jgi:sec-independent protein translocase protein TatB
MPAGLTSPAHLFVIIVVGLIVLGPEKLPQALRQVGRTMAEVRRWSDSISSEMRDVLSLDTGDEAPAATPLPPAATSVPQAQESDGHPPLHAALQEGGEWR